MSKLSRKEFLKRAGILSVSAVSVAAFLEACSSGGDKKGESGKYSSDAEPAKQDPAKPASKPEATKATASSAEADCSQYNADLTDNDKAQREALGYVDKSTDPEKNCANCQFWLADKFDGPCGGCQLFPNGAVTPQGNCNNWLAKGSV